MTEPTQNPPANTFGMLLIVAVLFPVVRLFWAYAPWGASFLPLALYLLIVTVRGIKKGLSS